MKTHNELIVANNNQFLGGFHALFVRSSFSARLHADRRSKSQFCQVVVGTHANHLHIPRHREIWPWHRLLEYKEMIPMQQKSAHTLATQRKFDETYPALLYSDLRIKIANPTTQTSSAVSQCQHASN